MKAVVEEIEVNIKLSTNYDPDRQYMAIKELSEIVERQGPKIPQDLLLRIIDTILRFLDDQNKALQGLAIDRLSKMIAHIPTEGNRRICVQMINKLADLQTSDEFRGVYSTALKSIIKEVSFELGSELRELLGDVVRRILQTDGTSKYNRIQELMIEVVDAFLAKWASMVDKIDFPKMQFSRLLLNNVINNSHLSKSSASSMCLGRLSAVLKQPELQDILYKQGLVSFLTSTSDDHNKKLAYSTLRLILQRHNRQLIKFVKQLLDFLFKQLRVYKADTNSQSDPDKLSLNCDLLQQILLSLLAIVQHFPKEIKTHVVVNHQYTKDIAELLAYSPGAKISYLQDKIQVEEDDDYYCEEEEDYSDNQSYRVRRGAVTLAGHMSKLDSSLGDAFIRMKGLYERLLESKPEVRQSTFEAFKTIVRNITVQENTMITDIQNTEIYPLKRAKTTYKDVSQQFLDRLLKKISQLISKNSIDQKSILQSSKLLSIACKSFATTIAQSTLILPIVLNLLTRELVKNRNEPQIKMTILEAFSSLFIKRVPDEEIQSRLGLMLESIDENSDVALEAFRAIDSLLGSYQEELGGGSGNVGRLIPVAVGKLGNTGYKPETRKAVVQCVSQLLKSYPTYLEPEQIRKILSELAAKLNGESSKKSILVALTKLNPKLALSKSVIQALNMILVMLTNNFINHQNQSWAQCAQQAVYKIIQILGTNFSQPSAKHLVQTSKQLRGIYPKYLDAVLHLYPKLFKGTLGDLFNCDELPVYVIEKLLENKITTQEECYGLIKQKARSENIDNVVRMLRVLSKDERPYLKEVGEGVWGRVALRLVGESGNPAHYEFLKGYSLGNHDNETKYQASIALGTLASKNFPTMFPILSTNLKGVSQQNLLNVYLSIKQAIIRSDASNYTMIQQQIELLLKDIKGDAGRVGPILNLLSECVAKQVNLKPVESQQLLSKILHASEHCHRQIFAAMFRFLSGGLIHNMDFIRPKINQLIQLLADKSPVLKAEALKSLIFLTNENPHAVLYCIDENSFRLVRQCSLIDDSLIREEVIVIRVVIDDGKPMRLQAFMLLETALVKPTNQAFSILKLHSQIMQAALDRIDDQKDFNMFLQRLILIKTLTTKAPEVVVAEASRFKKGVQARILKMDPQARYAKNVLQCFLQIYRSTNKDFSSEIGQIYHSICSKPEFKPILSQIEKQYD